MKNNYIISLAALSLIFLISNASFGQEMIVGGSMEEADLWKTCALNQDAGNTVMYEYNYTADRPTDGTGGCLYIAGTNTGTTGGNLTSFMFYQQVTLKCGESYTFDLAYKDIRTNNYWFEAYVGGREPAVGSEYGTGQGALLIGGYKSMNWAPACKSDAFDDAFKATACLPNATNPFTIAGTGDTVVFVGFRMGISDDDLHGYTFETFVDNVSLKGPFAANPVYTIPGKLGVYPNPASGKVTITNIESDNIRLVNLIGQEVLHFSVTQRNMDIDISELKKGLYLLKAGDVTIKLMIE